MPCFVCIILCVLVCNVHNFYSVSFLNNWKIHVVLLPLDMTFAHPLGKNRADRSVACWILASLLSTFSFWTTNFKFGQLLKKTLIWAIDHNTDSLCMAKKDCRVPYLIILLCLTASCDQFRQIEGILLKYDAI